MTELNFAKNRKLAKLCPCGKDNRDGKFAPFEGFENKGFCHSCGTTFLPNIEKPDNFEIAKYMQPKAPTKPIDLIPTSMYLHQLESLKHLYTSNNFILWLVNPLRQKFAFDTNVLSRLIQMYYLGNSNKYKGWNLFPYIDIFGNIRDIKTMDYDSNTGKRISIKNGHAQNRCHFVGKEILNNQNANLVRPFYGEHLLRGNSKLVRIFESEATATHAAAFFPDSVCLATGGTNGCKWTEKSKCSVLKNRTVILYPDIDAHEDWQQKAEILKSYGINVSVSNMIKDSALMYAEKNGIDYSELVRQKFDLRDILQYKNLDAFLSPAKTAEPESIAIHERQPERSTVPKFEPKTSETNEPKQSNVKFKTSQPQPENWSNEIAEIESYFASIDLPNAPYKLNDYSKILDVPKFVQSHLNFVKFNNGKEIFRPYLNRLKELKFNLTEIKQK